MYCIKWARCHELNQNHKDCQVMECFKPQPEATESSAPSGQAEFALLDADKQAYAITILKALANDLLPLWYSECNCYSTESMKKIEYKIDAFLESI